MKFNERTLVNTVCSLIMILSYNGFSHAIEAPDSIVTDNSDICVENVENKTSGESHDSVITEDNSNESEKNVVSEAKLHEQTEVVSVDAKFVDSPSENSLIKTSENNTQEYLVPHAILNMPKELREKSVSYRVHPGDSLSSISDKFLEDSCGWKAILKFEANREFISNNGNLIKQNTILHIPQPSNGRFVLYNPKSNETWITIARQFYGSYIWSQFLKQYNYAYGDVPDSYSNCVIKLPSEIYFGDHVMPLCHNYCCHGDYNSQNTFYALSSFLFGSDKYAKEIADFNNSKVNKIIKPNRLIHIPPSITSTQIGNI